MTMTSHDFRTWLGSPNVLAVQGSLADLECLGVSQDTRTLRAGEIFVALQGAHVDAKTLACEAVTKGARVLVLEGEPLPDLAIPQVRVRRAAVALGELAALFYGAPTARMFTVGVTGTNGKTSIAYLTEALWRAAGFEPGLVGTVVYRCRSWQKPAQHTTPMADALQGLLGAMADGGVDHLVMEVSSHGLEQERLAGCRFDAGIFTNLTQDHLDYHGTMEAYYQSKKKLFVADNLHKPNFVGIVNVQDAYGERLAGELGGVRLARYGRHATCDYQMLACECGLDGSLLTYHIRGHKLILRSPLIGGFNALNTLAVVALADVTGIDSSMMVPVLESFPGVPGRLELVTSQRDVHVFVDYAHTPDALENVVQTLAALKGPGRLITVFGCGGDRDRTKRPLMGRAAALGSDVVIVTSDNPRSEEPEAILHQILPGVILSQQACDGEKGYLEIVDRSQAIARALELARPGDVVLIAGKGHEDYQIIGKEKLPFSDVQVVREVMR